ncbi:MAG: molybdopterin-dependent oxidoreductase [Treponema sp.]|nr:molybdopterin-dependent oxidoreductase [Treponema sp.]
MVTEFQKLFTPAEDSDVKVITNTWTSSLHHPSYGETNGALCEVVNNVFRVYTPTQWPRHLSKTLSEVFSIDKKDIHIEKTRSTNTSINGIWRNAIFVSQAALAALKTGKAVKLSLSRQDQEIFMEHAIPAIISNRCVIQNNGLITAMDISIDLDMGYTNPFAQEIIDRLVIASCGIYNIQNLHIKATAHSSHTPPSSLSIESIDSQAFFAIENQIQKIAEITGLSPDELRKINIKQKASTQYTPFTFHFDYIEKAIDSVCKISDFNRKYVTYRYASLDKMTNTPANTFQTLASRGIGLACGFYGSGYFSSILHTADQYMEVVLEKDESVTIHATTPSKPIQQFWKTIVATQLAISDPNRITINSSFSPDNEPQLPESAYNNLTVMTQLLKKCCLTLNRKRNTQELPITVKKGISPSQRKSWDAQQFTGTPFLATALASAVVDLELDPSTYKQILRGIWVVVDAGKIISAKDAENTIKLDIQRLLAILIKDEIIKCPLIDIRFIQSDAEPKEIRGLMQNVLPAAFTSALSQALANTITDIPLLPKTLFIKGSHS